MPENDYKEIKQPHSRVEALMMQVIKNQESGGGGGDDPSNTASEEDIQGIEDSIWNS